MGKRSEQATSQVMMVSPQMATEWLENYRYDHQRSLKQWKVNRLVEAIKNGEWVRTEVHFAHAPGEGGKELECLTDGQHRLWAIVEAGVPAALTVSHTYYRSEAEIDHDYRARDQHTPRSPAEALATADLPAELELPAWTINKLDVAVRVLMDRFTHHGLNRRDAHLWNLEKRVRAIRNVAEEAKAYYEGCEGARQPIYSKLWNAPVLAVGLIVLHYQPGRAREFYERIAAEHLLAKHSGEKEMVDLLTDWRLKSYGYHEIARRAANCWNAYFRGKPLTRNQIRDLTVPINLEGTPYSYERPTPAFTDRFEL